MQTFDKMSTSSETAFVVLQGHFSELLMLFLRGDLNKIIGPQAHRVCEQCSNLPGIPNSQEKLLIMDHALVVLNRCLNYQLEGLINNSVDPELIMQLKKEQPNFDFGVFPEIEQILIDEYNTALDDLLVKLATSGNKLTFTTAALLTQSMASLMVLSPGCKKLVKMFKKKKMFQKLIKVLLTIKQSDIQFNKADS
mmetsp:Transcript_6164/g.9939  ORF Transcript_6164/g.9939 Transcript_6164/m.9939 type:complete len:195 (-) Transcript_6164:533-1117(-)